MIVHVLVAFSSCFMLYAMFRSFFLMCSCLGQHAHMLDIMSLAMPYLDLYVCMHVLCSYAYAFTCLYAWVYFPHAFMFISTCLDVYPHTYMHISMLICVDVCLHA